jgi:hypothetical protein
MISRNKAIIKEQRETLTIPLRFLLPALRLCKSTVQFKIQFLTKKCSLFIY